MRIFVHILRLSHLLLFPFVRGNISKSLGWEKISFFSSPVLRKIQLTLWFLALNMKMTMLSDDNIVNYQLTWQHQKGIIFLRTVYIILYSKVIRSQPWEMSGISKQDTHLISARWSTLPQNITVQIPFRSSRRGALVNESDEEPWGCGCDPWHCSVG